MPERDPEAHSARPPTRSRTRRRTTVGLSLGILLGIGTLVAANGAGGVSASQLLHAVDTAKHEPIPSPSASQAAASPSKAAATPSTSSQPKATPPTTAPALAKAPAKVAAPPTTASGQSITLAGDQQPSQVGALFPGGLSSGHNCTASVVNSPAGDLIVTAAHCLSSGSGGGSFVPAYRDGTAPYGVWQIDYVVEDSAWTSGRDPDHDVAFAVVKPLNGRSLQSVVGAYELDTSGTSGAEIQLTGYPQSTNEPITCTGSSSSFSSTQLQVYCTAYTDGTSGSGWISNYDATTGSGTLIGVIGGYETGGDTPDVSYSALFGSSTRSLYQQAVSTAGTSGG
jgi:V8-like Glu-specific endopeptidase